MVRDGAELSSGSVVDGLTGTGDNARTGRLVGQGDGTAFRRAEEASSSNVQQLCAGGTLDRTEPEGIDDHGEPDVSASASSRSGESREGSRRERASTHGFRVAAGPKPRAQHATRPWHAGRRVVKQHYKTLKMAELTLKMAELATSLGLPRPEIEDVSDCVTMRFHLSQFTPAQHSGTNATERQKAILALLDQADDGLVAARNSCAKLSGHECTSGEKSADEIEGTQADRFYRAPGLRRGGSGQDEDNNYLTRRVRLVSDQDPIGVNWRRRH